MIRVPRMVTATAAVLALAAGTPGLAHASPESADGSRAAGPRLSAPPGNPGGTLPAGWQITGTGAGRQLVWRSPDPVPVGDARVEFYAGDRLLGRPTADGDRRGFRLALGDARLGPETELKVLAGGRRLDAAGAARTPHPLRPGTPPRLPALPPAGEVDPGVPGHYRTTSGEYDLKSVKLPGFRAPVEMRATVVAPTDAPGRRPLALFLHGRHYTCFNARGSEDIGWPCKNGMRPVPSYRGYLKDQKLLASQGYVTVSISANGINGQDETAVDGGAQARSSLVRQHLAHWAQWAADLSGAPKAVRESAPADLDRVLLVGHSRGGEGVNRAALDSLNQPPADEDGYHGPVRWNIRGNVLIGPTLFGQNPVPDVPSMTILPGCDGDVSDLQGQIYVDGTRGVSRGTALHSAVYVNGANHNFFNTEWTPGKSTAPAEDDWGNDEPDAVCKRGTRTRLTADQQHAAGATYIAAAARLFLDGDDRVRPLLDGSNRRAPSADPARVATHALGANRTPVIVPDTSLAIDGGRLCRQVDRDPAKACLPPDKPGASPHFAGWMGPEPARYAMAMSWSRPGATTSMRPARPVSVAGAESLALRLIVPPNTTGTQADVTLTDTAGRKANLGRVRLDGLPGTDRTTSYWAREARVPLTAAVRGGLDLKQVKSVELTWRNRSGKAWLMDAWGWRPGTPEAHPTALTRVDVGRLTVKEGDSGTRTYRVPVRVTGEGVGQVRVFTIDSLTGKSTTRTVTVHPGGHELDVPVTVRGNTRYDLDYSHDVSVKAVRGTVVGAYHGGVTALNDDKMPKATVKPVADRVTEGKRLSWRVSLSQPADMKIEVRFKLLPVRGGKELSTKDVDRRWLKDAFGQSPNPARPLSKVMDEGEPYLYLEIPAGKKSITVSVPTLKDRVREPEESLRMRLITLDEHWMEHDGPVVTGKVKNAA